MKAKYGMEDTDKVVDGIPQRIMNLIDLMDLGDMNKTDEINFESEIDHLRIVEQPLAPSGIVIGENVCTHMKSLDSSCEFCEFWTTYLASKASGGASGGVSKAPRVSGVSKASGGVSKASRVSSVSSVSGVKLRRKAARMQCPMCFRWVGVATRVCPCKKHTFR